MIRPPTYLPRKPPHLCKQLSVVVTFYCQNMDGIERNMYDKLLEDGQHSDEEDDPSYQRRRKHTLCSSWSCGKSIHLIVTAVLALALVYQQWRLSYPLCQRGFSTDYANLGNIIGFKEQKYSNPIVISDDRSRLEIPWQDDRYSSKPRYEVDRAWDELLSYSGFNLSVKSPNAEPALGQTIEYDNEKVLVGLEVFHALHCLNMVRWGLYRDTYVVLVAPEETELHLEHCVDYLRQYIQCNADLTPMWTGDMGGGFLMVKPYTTHTCRDFDQIIGWIEKYRV